MLRLRSCASSTMIVSYAASMRSPCVSASRIPSVISFTKASGRVSSVKRTLKPTRSPTLVSSSCAMRVATARAASLRGCVWPMRPRSPRPMSRQIFGSCVVLPEPVSPQTITTWCSRMAAPIASARCETGSSGGYATPGRRAARASRRPTAASTARARRSHSGPGARCRCARSMRRMSACASTLIARASACLRRFAGDSGMTRNRGVRAAGRAFYRAPTSEVPA